MRRTRLLLALPLLLGAAAETTAAQVADRRGEAMDGPRDVREIFLALPLPSPAPERRILGAVRDRLATAARRRAELDAAVREDPGNVVVDTRNGYLKLLLSAEGGPEELAPVVVLTYFTRPNGERLVVMQLSDYAATPTGAPVTENYFWTLTGGRFVPRDARELLPPVTFEDFWGSQAPPRGVQRGYFLTAPGASRIEWPRQGTVARFEVFTPYFEDGDPRGITDFAEKRRFTAMDLVWNRQAGRFTRGAKQPYVPGDEHDHH